MTFYLSMRPIRYRNEIISPKQSLKYNFPGILFSWKCLGFDRKLDGRWLYEIELDKSYSSQEAIDLQEVFIEALASFGSHLKTVTSAKELAEKVTKQVYKIVGKKIEVDEK